MLRIYGASQPVSPALIFPNALTNAVPGPAVTLTTTGTTYPVLQNPLCATNYRFLWPGATYVHTMEARENPPLFFRRALKIVNGITLSLGTSCYGTGTNPPCGLTVAAENPVYIQGDYNSPGGSLTGTGTVAAAVAGDAVTLLSDNWNDVNTFTFPQHIVQNKIRNAVPTAYRAAIIGGKGIPFKNVGTTADFGTDGGVHNFLRFLEYWGVNCYYEGSMVSFFYNRQAVGTYKGSGVYSPPNRLYSFDQNFTLGPAYLPPRTPVLRSVNTIGFSQEILPTQ